MLFPTPEFALFFLAVFALSWAACAWSTLRKSILLVASYVFYSWWDWRFASLLLACSTLNWAVGLWLDGLPDGRKRKSVLMLGLALNLGALAYFKYWGFFLSSLAELLATFGFGRDMKVIEVLLPIGVSFFTFQGVSYVVDIYRRQLRATESALDMLLLVSFFPHLVAGPLVRASELLPQLAKPVDPSAIRAGRAMLLIALGLFKKVVIAHYLATELVNPIFEAPQSYGGLDLLFGAYGYAVQIYCDFSAYSDMAIGFALLLGYEFPRNFDQPYRATSLREFWHRWHISLSSWLRDYLYKPLGGSRGGKLATYRNLFLTMLLGGLWHGAAWTFVFWGVLHGGALCVERFWKNHAKSIPETPVGKVLRTILVFHFVCLTWIFFNADSFGAAGEYLLALVHNIGQPSQLVTRFVVVLLAAGMIGQFLPVDLAERIERGLGRAPLPAQAVLFALAVLVVSAWGPGALAPFIYFRF